MAWTESTVKSWGKPNKRTVKTENRLRADIKTSGKVTWYFSRKSPEPHKFLGTYPEVNLREAKQLVAEQKASKFLGTNPDRKLTFSEYVNSELFIGEKNKERPSNKESMRALNNLICPVIGHIKMETLTIKDINKFKVGYQAKNSTINRLLNEIRAVITHAHKNGVIEKNIKIEDLEERDTKTERRYLQQSEIDAIRKESRITRDVRGNVIPLDELPKTEYLKRGHLPLVCDIAIFCGMRQGEILKLQYSDITTWDESVEESWMFRLRASTTKSGKSRDVHLPKFLKNYLDKWWYENLTEEELTEVLADRKKKKKSRKHHNKRLFPYKSIQTSWENLSDRAELPNDINFHSLRHHFCSNALVNNVPIHIVKEMAGHASIETTEKYLHAIPSESAKLIQRYFESVYRFEDVKEEKEKPKPIMVIETGGTGEQSIQFDTNYEFDVDEWLKNNPIEINLELEKDGSYKLQRLIGKLSILPT
jgi:integrase